GCSRVLALAYPPRPQGPAGTSIGNSAQLLLARSIHSAGDDHLWPPWRPGSPAAFPHTDLNSHSHERFLFRGTASGVAFLAQPGSGHSNPHRGATRRLFRAFVCLSPCCTKPSSLLTRSFSHSPGHEFWRMDHTDEPGCSYDGLC